MPHVQELSDQQWIDRLFGSAHPELKPVIRMKVVMRQPLSPPPNGAQVFGPNWVEFEINATNRIIGEVSYNISKPIFPGMGDESEIKTDEITFRLANPDGILATTQADGVIRASEIERGQVYIFAQIGDSTNLFPVYRGKLVGPPREARGFSEFTVRSTAYDAIRKSVLYDDYNNPNGQHAYVKDGVFFSTPLEVATSGGEFCQYHGIITFDPVGTPITSVTNSGSDKIILLRLNLSGAAKVGKYEIEFTGPKSFVCRYPDNVEYQGNIINDFESPNVSIPGVFNGSLSGWGGQFDFNGVSFTQFPFNAWNNVDATGVKITFQIAWTAKGNPWSMIKVLLERVFLENYGQTPTENPGLPIDWATLNALEKRFKWNEVWVSVTNLNNSVWEEQDGRPLNYLAVAQSIAHHCLSSIILLQDGTISATTPFLDDRAIYDLTGNESIVERVISGRDQVNYIDIKFGSDGFTGNYATNYTNDFRVDTDTEIRRLTIPMPYYKLGQSNQKIDWLMKTILRRYMLIQNEIELTITPNMGLPLYPGDVVRVVSGLQPVFAIFVEIIAVSVTIGREVKVKAIPIQPPEGKALKLCTGKFDTEVII